MSKLIISQENLTVPEELSPAITFQEFADIYQADMAARLKPSTLSGKKRIIRDKILPYFGALPMCKITVQHVRKWQSASRLFWWQRSITTSNWKSYLPPAACSIGTITFCTAGSAVVANAPVSSASASMISVIRMCRFSLIMDFRHLILLNVSDTKASPPPLMSIHIFFLISSSYS